MSAALGRVATFEPEKLPHGWRAATLEDVVGVDGVFVDGDWVESKDQDPEGDVRLIQLADVGDGEYRDRSERFLTSARASELGCTFLEPGDVLVARMPDPLGRACIFPGDKKRAVTVVDVAVVRPREAEINTRWLMYCINAPHFRRVVASLQSGSTRQRISRKNLAKIVFPLPPRDWQDQIAAEIEEQFSRLDEAVGNLTRVRANLKRYKAAVLKAAVEGRLVPTEAEVARTEGRAYEGGDELLQRICESRSTEKRGRTQISEIASETNGFAPLPEGWVWATYEQVGRLQLGRQRAPKFHTGPNMRPYLRVQNVFEDRLDLSDVMEMNFPPADLEKFALAPGDLLLNEGQSPELLGRPAIYRGEVPGACFTNTLIRLRARDGVRVEFALLVARHHMHSGRFVDEGSITTNIAHLSVGRLASVEFPLPPTAEQDRIVAEADRQLSIVAALERSEIWAGIQTSNLRAAILENTCGATPHAGRLERTRCT